MLLYGYMVIWTLLHGHVFCDLCVFMYKHIRLYCHVAIITSLYGCVKVYGHVVAAQAVTTQVGMAQVVMAHLRLKVSRNASDCTALGHDKEGENAK